MLGATILVLLVASINYQLNLGYLLTFLLAGSTVVGMHVCHGTLRGITMNLIAPDAQFAGASAVIGINLQSQRRSIRHGIGLAVLGSGHWVWTDVPAQGNATVHIAFKPNDAACTGCLRLRQNALPTRYFSGVDSVAARRPGVGVPGTRTFPAAFAAR